ncbi:MAG: PIN domain-containing protein [Planctomycetes bacterium]|nr:PIN domain-containing protein [Planctomycetota bacterium]
MKYLLDTNTCIYFLNGNESLKKKFREIGVYSLSISNCVLAELYFGAYRSKKVEENVKPARLFGKIKAELRSKGTIIEDFDILIASIAISNNHILITNNTEHFERIEGLKIQNWVNM